MAHGTRAAHRASSESRRSSKSGCWSVSRDASHRVEISTPLPPAKNPPGTADRPDDRRPGESIILVVDDEVQILRALDRGLARAGHEVDVARSGEAGVAMAATRNPDLVLLDLRMPDLDGIEVVKRLRTWTDVPVLLLSGNGTERARVAALDAGADDFIDKPFSMEELRARVTAALRRSGPWQRDRGGSAVLRQGDLEIDLVARQVRVGNRAVKLTPIQWRLLETLLSQPGHLLTYQQVIQGVWSSQHGNEARDSLRAHVRTLRRKLGDDARAPRYIETELGVGYRWIGESEA
jgi:two-component system, OmpR family, KDP operon response regulator KdpE